ncbi:MAG: Gldg family protein [Saccharofermentanales bacterium]
MKNKEIFTKDETSPEITEKVKVKKPSDKRNRSLKLISVSSAILFIVIVIIFNIVFESLFGARLKWDWSQTDMFSIGDVSTQLVGKLDKEVKIVGLYVKGTVSQYADVELLLDQYVLKSNGKITVQYIDPVQTPSILKQLDPDDILKPEQQTFVVKCDATKKAKVITQTDIYQTEFDQTTYEQKITGVIAERSFSGAIVYTTSAKTPVVYMTKGHDELDYNTNYTTMTAILKDNNFTVKDLDLRTAKAIPADAELLIMLSPKDDINVIEKDLVDKYLKTGKGLLVMSEYNSATFPVLNTLLADYNIELTNNRIREVDTERIYQNNAYYFLADAPSSFITPDAVAAGTLVQNARVINELKNTKSWITVNPVFQTGDKALTEENGDPDKTGAPFVTNIAVASDNKGSVDGVTVKNSAKVMVIGASDYMGDSILQFLGSQVYNMYSFYSSVRWLTNSDTNDLLITAKELPTYKLAKGGPTAFWFATIICVILIPIGLMITALIVYRKRKNL